MNSIAKWAATAVLAAGLTSAARSQVVAFSNFGQNDTFSTIGWVTRGANTEGGRLDQGSQFMSAVSGEVSSIKVAVTYYSGQNEFTFSLYTDNGNSIGNFLKSWTVGGPGDGEVMGVIDLIDPPGSPAGPQITQGQKYWLVGKVASNTAGQWNWNPINDANWRGQGVETDFTYMTAQRGVMKVFVAAVPEPATLAALGIGIAAVLRKRKR